MVLDLITIQITKKSGASEERILATSLPPDPINQPQNYGKVVEINYQNLPENVKDAYNTIKAYCQTQIDL
jgi:hypothetical protein